MDCLTKGEEQQLALFPWEKQVKPLSLEALKHLYDFTDWRVILFDDVIAPEYSKEKISTLSIFKALALPYLIRIPNERSLSRELEEKESLQLLCGFSPGEKVPSRETIWHFRNKYANAYPDLMLKILIAMVLSGKRPNLDLPFIIHPISENNISTNRKHQVFKIDEYRPEIEVWRTMENDDIGDALLNSTADNGFLNGHGQTNDLSQFNKELEDINPNGERLSQKQDEYVPKPNHYRKVGFVGELALPIEVKTKLYNGQIVHFLVKAPPWLNMNNKVMDTLTGIGSKNRKKLYTACNILVFREHNGRRQLLLCQRKNGYGSGQFAIPGGKQQLDESLEECAVRELREETGLRLIKARPVSLKITHFHDKPLFLSIGVLAEEYQGIPKNTEEEQHTEWEWYDLDRLPEPLFLPSRIVISHYINNKFPNLEWEDVLPWEEDESQKVREAQESRQMEFSDILGSEKM